MGSVDFIGLLYAIWHNVHSYVSQGTEFVDCSSVEICCNFTFLKLFTKPSSLLLEDESSEKIYKGNSSRGVLLVKIHLTISYDLCFWFDTAVVHTEIEVAMFYKRFLIMIVGPPLR